MLKIISIKHGYKAEYLNMFKPSVFHPHEGEKYNRMFSISYFKHFRVWKIIEWGQFSFYRL